MSGDCTRMYCVVLKGGVMFQSHEERITATGVTSRVIVASESELTRSSLISHRPVLRVSA
jgi:hypothetical protein